MTSTKPYLIRAIHEWCADNGFTPYLAVAVDGRTRVPREYVKDGHIVLNVGTDATSKLHMGNEEITFHARFNGAAFPVHVPIAAVAAIYAKESGQGMTFDSAVDGEAGADGAEPSAPAAADANADANVDPPVPPPPSGGRSHLTRVK